MIVVPGIWVLDKPGGVEAHGFLSRISAEIPLHCHVSSLMAYELSLSPVSFPAWTTAGRRQVTNSTAAALWKGLGPKLPSESEELSIPMSSFQVPHK